MIHDQIDKLTELRIRCKGNDDISNLSETQIEMSEILCLLCEEESNCYKNHLIRYSERKNKSGREFIILKESYGVSESQIRAENASYDFKQEEVEWDYRHNKLKNIRLTNTKFIDALTQKISHLKKEWEFNRKRV